MENKLQKIYPTDYSYRLLIVQNLWQALYHILSIIFLKEFIKLNVNTDTMIKNLKVEELNITITTVEYTNFKDHLTAYKCLCCNKKYQQKFDVKLKNDFFIYTSILSTTIISLFYC